MLTLGHPAKASSVFTNSELQPACISVSLTGILKNLRTTNTHLHEQITLHLFTRCKLFRGRGREGAKVVIREERK